MASSLYKFLEEDGDEAIIGCLWKCLLLLIVGSSLFKIPYGKNTNDKGSSLFSVTISARPAWFIIELPALVVPLFLLLNVGGRYVGGFNPNIILLGMFILHYINRVCIFSISLRGRDTPLAVVLFGVLTCTVNGYVQGRSLTHYVYYDPSWFYDPRFLIGVSLFLLGMAINIHSDNILRSLRTPGERAYKIPHGGMFEYVSGANYFGESLEWTGYAIACWSLFGAYFALWTVLFLGSRALQYHKFYLDKFEDYPKNRKAFVPFVL